MTISKFRELAKIMAIKFQNRKMITKASVLARNPFIYLYLALTIGLLTGLQSRFLGQNGDAAGFADALSPGQSLLKLNFAYGLSIKRLRELIATNPIDLPGLSLANPYAEVSFMHSHPYIFSFFFRIFPTFSLPIYSLPLFLLASSYALGITLLLKRIAQSKLTALTKIILALATLTSPIFTEAVNGQPYFDKLFFGPCIAIIMIITNEDLTRQRNRVALLILLLLSITLSERTALMSCLITLFLLGVRFGFKPRECKENVQIIALSMIGLVWFFVWMSYVSQNPDMANLSFKNYLTNLIAAINGERRNNFALFLLNIAPFLILVFMRIALLPLCLIAILPNLIVSIGGAELTGYSTHYHSIYLPIIFALGIVSITQVTKKNAHGKQTTVLFFAGIALVTSFLFNSNGKLGIQDLTVQINQAWQRTAESFGLIPGDVIEARKSNYSDVTKLFEGLAFNSKLRISAPEKFMPALVDNDLRNIDYFPVGVGEDDLVVVPYTDINLNVIEVSIYGLVPIENRPIWSDKIQKILDKSYIRVNSASGNFGYLAIYRKL